MKRFIILTVCGLFLAASLGAGVVKQTKSQISFKGFGSLSTEASHKVTAERSLMDTQNDFKGKGLLGSLAGKALLQSGHYGQLLNLTDLTQTTLDFKRKEYRVAPIQPIQMQGGRGGTSTQAGDKSETKILKNEFKVEKTGESKDINGFPCVRYVASWIVDWENTQTKQTGTDKMLTDVWTTPETATLREAMAEEMKFGAAYMKAIGLDIDTFQQDVLGGSWMSILAALKPTEQRPTADTKAFGAEMKKIKGYPVIIDGKLFTETKGGPQAEQPQEESGGGLFGKLAKSVIKKKPEDTANEPALAFYSEVKSVNVVSLGDSDFQVPPDFKKKG